MKKMVLVFALVALALSGTAMAQVDPAYQNNIGIYFDEAGSNNCDALPPSTPTPAYVVFTKVTANEVLGWEAKLTLTPNLLALNGIVPRGQFIDAGSRPDEYVVGLASPLPVSGGVFVAADLELFATDGAPGYAYADEIYFSLLENGLPAYIDAQSVGYPLNPVFGSTNDPILIVNGDCAPVGVEDAAFGAVKSLYR